MDAYPGRTFHDVKPGHSTPTILAKIKVKADASPGAVFDPFVAGQYSFDANDFNVDSVSPRVEAAT